MRGSDETDKRVDRICAILEAGRDTEGFDYEDPGEEEDGLALRNDLIEWRPSPPPFGRDPPPTAQPGISILLVDIYFEPPLSTNSILGRLVVLSPGGGQADRWRVAANSARGGAVEQEHDELRGENPQ